MINTELLKLPSGNILRGIFIRLRTYLITLLLYQIAYVLTVFTSKNLIRPNYHFVISKCIEVIILAFYLLGLFSIIQPPSVATLNATNYSYVEYIQNFNPNKVWERIEVRNKQNGRNTTVKDEFEEILKSIDQTDVLLQLKVQDGNPKILIQKDGRRWKPPLNYDRGIVPDIFNLRRRYIELMKQAIYQTRNKMIVMQELREKYRKVSVYKMGFLMAKTDRACKKFSNIAYKAFRLCSQMRQSATDGVYFQDMLELEERMLNLWMDIDLLVHLVTINDENCRRMLNQVMTNRKKEWKFVD